ncbi:RsmB/NOP family class I SAM-dependent RNA methyltransferase [Candidatus Bathyarchaeota archaeon]|nr:MAG: RsmB/NOP family class I SAM-dependent RNA methyltransferase [Candidatus Bathyarchaeota archaeon]
MSGREFFVARYEELGWKYRDVKPRQAVRVNSTNTMKTDVARRLVSLGVKLQKIPFLEKGYWICKSEFSVGATSEYLLGLYSIQEAAAQIPATLFTRLKDKIVLDACAAPGGKTVQLADSMQNTGAIIALDTKKRRLIALSNNLERCRVENTIVYHMDATHASQLEMKFNRILLDVPCSGNFVTDRDWFMKRTLKDVKKNAELQKRILAEATRILKDHGEIVYATCSLEPEENELNIDWAIENLNLQTEQINCYGEKASTNIFGKQLNSTIEYCRRIWPGQTQGFFVCKLKKRVCT